jgi:4-carboxymuconolactone decarboxylase
MAADGGLSAWFGPLGSGDVDGERARVLGKLEAAGNLNEVTALLANAPHGFRPYVLMSDALLVRGALAPRLRELVILALAAAVGSGYERQEHERMAGELVEPREHELLRQGEAGIDGFEGTERDALRLALDLHRGAPIEQARWQSLVEAIGAEAALDLALTVAWWGGFVPTVLRAFGVEEDE